ncbi:MAG TPA: M4 family metallopeptidase [Actinomycetota bacterium]
MRRSRFLLLLTISAALLPLALPAAGLAPALARETPATGANAAAFTATATGQVFDPNPVVTLQDETLTDQQDKDYPALNPAYRTVTLTRLDGSGYLHGDFATIDPKQKTPAFSSTGQFVYLRSDDRFEQVMAYYHVTAAQTYIQSLGFTTINNEPQNLLLNPIGQDNSYYDPKTDIITFGKGGVDDAEDAEMIWHEYGHAIQDSQVPGFGSGNQAGSIGEGFGDYWAFTMSQADSPDTATTPLACIADWDSTAYTYNQLPHCLRRVDTNKTMADYQPNGDVHVNGQIWSRALHDINLALGRDPANTVILQAQFAFSPSTTFQAAAQATVDTATALYGSATASQVQAAFAARGIL